MSLFWRKKKPLLCTLSLLWLKKNKSLLCSMSLLCRKKKQLLCTLCLSWWRKKSLLCTMSLLFLGNKPLRSTLVREIKYMYANLSRYALDTHTVLKFSDLFIFTVRIQNTFSRGVRYKHNVAGHQGYILIVELVWTSQDPSPRDYLEDCRTVLCSKLPMSCFCKKISSCGVLSSSKVMCALI